MEFEGSNNGELQNEKGGRSSFLNNITAFHSLIPLESHLYQPPASLLPLVCLPLLASLLPRASPPPSALPPL